MDIGIFEFGLVLIVGLLVIGPERMPELARKIIYWWTIIKDGINNTRAEIEREIGADDIRRQLRNEKIMKELGESKAAIESTVKETTENLQRFKHIGEEHSRELAKTIHNSATHLKDSAIDDVTTTSVSSDHLNSEKEPTGDQPTK